MKFFNQPEILAQIGEPRLCRFLDNFTDAFRTANISVPTQDVANGDYAKYVAAFLGSSSLPERLRVAISAMEQLAEPHNSERLQSALAPHLASMTIPRRSAPLDLALELWFISPDSLLAHASSCAPDSTVQQLDDSTLPPSSIQNPASSIGPSASPRPSTADPPPSSSDLTIQQLNDSTPSSSSIQNPVSSIDPCHRPLRRSDRIDVAALLFALLHVLRRFAVLPKWAAETLALWIVHTYAFHLRNVTTYIGIESPEMRCGKTTLLTLLGKLVHRPIPASNISPPAFFRVIEDLAPTLLIDEADTFLKGNDQLRGILNAGYKRDNAYVWRAIPTGTTPVGLDTSPGPDDSTVQQFNDSTSSQLARFSCWCPKVMAKIGRFPGTLADRCILIRMHRKTQNEQCARITELDAVALQEQCTLFALQYCREIGQAKPQIPKDLNDRAAEIWEPLLAIADIAGGDWPELARQAAINLSSAASEQSPITALLGDLLLLFTWLKAERIFSKDLVHHLNSMADRPWLELRKGKQISDIWLAQQLRPYGVRPRSIWINGQHAKGYLFEDFKEVFARYLPNGAPTSNEPPQQNDTEIPPDSKNT